MTMQRYTTPAIMALACMGLVSALSLAGCKRTEPVPPATPSAPLDPDAGKDPPVTSSYLCDGGHRVDIVGESTARITLSDGRVVRIGYVENSRPRSFMDRGLRFVVGAKEAMLIQSEGPSMGCKPAG